MADENTSINELPAENSSTTAPAASSPKAAEGNFGFQNPFQNPEAANQPATHKSAVDTWLPAATAGAAAIGAAINPVLGMGIAAVGTIAQTIIDSREHPPSPPPPPPAPLYNISLGQEASLQSDQSYNLGTSVAVNP